MNDLDTKYTNEAEILRLQWNKFVNAMNSEIDSNDDNVHVHTPPALVLFFDKVITESIDLENPDYAEIVNIMDSIFQFGGYFRDKGFIYEDLTKCECVQITSEDIELMVQGIN